MNRKPEIDEGIEFPLTVTFEDGSTEQYADQSDLEMNLEEFDSSTEPECRVVDANGHYVELTLRLLRLESVRLKRK